MKIDVYFKDKNFGIKHFDPVLDIDITVDGKRIVITYRVYIGEFQDYQDKVRCFFIDDIRKMVIT